MCEFNVIVEEKTVFENAVYAKSTESEVEVRNISGESSKFENCEIVEVDVNKLRLVLSRIKH